MPLGINATWICIYHIVGVNKVNVGGCEQGQSKVKVGQCKSVNGTETGV